MSEEKAMNYIHYSPEFNEIVVMDKKYTSFFRNAFSIGKRGKTPLIYLDKGNYGFSKEGY